MENQRQDEGDGPSSKKRIRLDAADEGEGLKSPIPATRSSTSGVQMEGTKAGEADSLRHSPSRMVPLLPAHSTSQEHVDRSPLLRITTPNKSPVAPPPSNRASLAHLINPDPDAGFSVFHDGGRRQSPPVTASTVDRQLPPVHWRTSVPALPHIGRPISPSDRELPSIDKAFSLPERPSRIRNPASDRGDEYVTGSQDAGSSSSSGRWRLSQRRATDDAEGGGGNVSRDPMIPQPPAVQSRDPEAYFPKDQAWFALGSAAVRDKEGWSVDRVEGYNEGFSDAVEAVKEGVIGVNGMRFAKPVFWRPVDFSSDRFDGYRPGDSANSAQLTAAFPYSFDGSAYIPAEQSAYGFTASGTTSDQLLQLMTPRMQTSPSGLKIGKRLPISCYPCRKRKLKCDGDLPCGPCVKRKSETECAYESDVRRRGKGKKQIDEAEWLASFGSGYGTSYGAGPSQPRQPHMGPQQGGGQRTSDDMTRSASATTRSSDEPDDAAVQSGIDDEDMDQDAPISPRSLQTSKTQDNGPIATSDADRDWSSTSDDDRKPSMQHSTWDGETGSSTERSKSH